MGVWEFSGGLNGICDFAEPVFTIAGTTLQSLDFGAVRAGTLLVRPTTIVNGAPTAGSAAGFAVELVGGGAATVVQTGDIWTIDLGPLGAGTPAGPVALAVVNTGAAGADLLGGTIGASGGGGRDRARFDFCRAGVGRVVRRDTVAGGGATETLTFSPTDSAASGFVSALATETVILSDRAAPCFAAGTRIATRRGAVRGSGGGRRGGRAGRRLAAGGGAGTAGALRAPSGAGHGQAGAVRAFAFGEAPVRDLVLSPDHALWIAGVLMPVHLLVDGERIVREKRDVVSYQHVALDRHDVLLAEGLPAESCLDTGNRSRFASARLVDLPVRAAAPCASVVLEGRRLTAIRRNVRGPERAPRAVPDSGAMRSSAAS